MEVTYIDCFVILFLVSSFLNIIRRLFGQSVFHSQEAFEKLLDTNVIVVFYFLHIFLHIFYICVICALKASVLLLQLLQSQINKH